MLPVHTHKKQLSEGAAVLHHLSHIGGLRREFPRGKGIYPDSAALSVILLHLVSIKSRRVRLCKDFLKGRHFVFFSFIAIFPGPP